MKRPSIGIFGFGSFGKFFAGHLAKSFSVTVNDEAASISDAKAVGVRLGTAEETATNDIVICAVPVQSLELLLQIVSRYIRSETTVMDVCSVKAEPFRLMSMYLPHVASIIRTHPLFGPRSASGGSFAGHKIAICMPFVKTWAWGCLRECFVKKWKLKIVQTWESAHDIRMAEVQGLTHYICRALCNLSVQSDGYSTVAHKKICEAVNLLSEDSWELFQTIENANPYAKEIRQRFVQQLLDWERR